MPFISSFSYIYTKPVIKHTIVGTHGLMFLIKQPNHKLWNELKEEQAI